MSVSPIDPRMYYAQPGPVTHLPRTPITADLLADLPESVEEIARVVQSNLIHIFWASRYGVDLSEERKAEVQIRSADEMLRRIHAASPAPLTTPRDPARRLVGNCRDFTVLACALFNRQGIPARARCGFGTYFRDKIAYVDHWVCEVWNEDETRWIQVDVQLDAFQQDALTVDFDPLDVPHDRFLSGGRAWQAVRKHGADPDQFGIFDMHGLWFIQGDMIRDLAALNKLPLLPWDSWGVMLENEADYDYALLDRVAALTLDNAQFDAMRALYEADERLRVPPVITSFGDEPEPRRVALADVLPVIEEH